MPRRGLNVSISHQFLQDFKYRYLSATNACLNAYGVIRGSCSARPALSLIQNPPQIGLKLQSRLRLTVYIQNRTFLQPSTIISLCVSPVLDRMVEHLTGSIPQTIEVL